MASCIYIGGFGFNFSSVFTHHTKWYGILQMVLDYFTCISLLRMNGFLPEPGLSLGSGPGMGKGSRCKENFGPPGGLHLSDPE